MQETLTCGTCGETWERERARGRKPRECGECRHDPQRRLKTRAVFRAVCSICDSVLETTQPLAKRCSDACRDEHNRRRAARARAERKPYTVRPPRGPWQGVRECRFCDRAFEARSPKATVCYSDACQRAKHAERSRDYQRAYREKHGISYAHAKYPEARRDAASRRRALVRGASAVEDVSRETVFERDEWTCGLCGLPIDPALAFPDPGSVSLDHIIPLSLGGTHTLDNVQAAHLSCNSAKGARAEA